MDKVTGRSTAHAAMLGLAASAMVGAQGHKIIPPEVRDINFEQDRLEYPKRCRKIGGSYMPSPKERFKSRKVRR